MHYNPNPPETNKDLITMAILLTLLHLKSRSTLYDWLNKSSPKYKKDLVPPFRIGRQLYWYKEDIEKFIQSCASAAK